MSDDLKLPECAELMAIRPDALNRASRSTAVSAVVTSASTAKFVEIVIEGPLAQRAGWFAGYDSIAETFAAALEQSDGVLLRINSPGGMVAGCFEAVGQMREAKVASGKPVVAYVDECACSAAYALATVADAIVVPPSGYVGSIGVISTAVEYSEALKAQGIRVVVVTSGARKADGHPAVAMSAEAVARMQRDVDALAQQFFELVADARALSPRAIERLEADVFLGSAALSVGLADAVGGYVDAVSLLKEKAMDNMITMEHHNAAVAAAVESAVTEALTKVATEAKQAIDALQAANAALLGEVAHRDAIVSDLAAKVAKNEAARLDAKVESFVGVKAGITPANVEHFKALARSNEAQFDAIVAAMPDGIVNATSALPAAPARGAGLATGDAAIDKINRLTDERLAKNPGESRHVAMRAVMNANPELCSEN